jgi:hypothetical protein
MPALVKQEEPFGLVQIKEEFQMDWNLEVVTVPAPLKRARIEVSVEVAEPK